MFWLNNFSTLWWEITLYLVTFSYSRVLEYKETDTATLIRFYNDVLNVEKKSWYNKTIGNNFETISTI